MDARKNVVPRSAPPFAVRAAVVASLERSNALGREEYKRPDFSHFNIGR